MAFPIPLIRNYHNDSSATSTSPPSESIATEQKDPDSFHSSISNFITFAEMEPNQAYVISGVCEKFNFQRRRFYDVVNVLEAVGACQRINVDTIMWFGLRNVQPCLVKLAKQSGATFPHFTLAQVLPSEPSVSIGRLTQLFILCFVGLNARMLDIRKIAQYISRENGRLKTTLCKLYQITHILAAAGVIEKTAIPCQILVSSKYFIKSINEEETLPSYSIEFLLSHPKPSSRPNTIEKRWLEFTNAHSSVQIPIKMSMPRQISTIPMMFSIPSMNTV